MKKTYHTHKSIEQKNKNVISRVTNTCTNNINITKNININQEKESSNQKKSKVLSDLGTFCSISGLSVVVILGFILPIFGNNKCAEQVSIDDENLNIVQSEKSYKEYLINNIGMDYLVTECIYADFDYNNTYEMFAIADNELESALYYVDSNGLLKLDEWKYAKITRSRLKILNLDQQSFIVLTDGARATGHKGDIWTVYKDTPCQIFSKNVYSVEKNEYNEIIIKETYVSGAGHSGFGITMKPYYFYYSDGKLLEYGGTIKYGSNASQPPKEFLNYSESEKILKEIDGRGFYVVNYLFRANNTITLNLKIKDYTTLQTTSKFANEYETYRIVDNSLVLEGSGLGSNYLSPYCLVPEAAIY